MCPLYALGSYIFTRISTLNRRHMVYQIINKKKTEKRTDIQLVRTHLLTFFADHCYLYGVSKSIRLIFGK